MTSTNSASAGSRKSIFMYQDLPRRRTIVFHALVATLPHFNNCGNDEDHHPRFARMACTHSSIVLRILRTLRSFIQYALHLPLVAYRTKSICRR